MRRREVQVRAGHRHDGPRARLASRGCPRRRGQLGEPGERHRAHDLGLTAGEVRVEHWLRVADRSATWTASDHPSDWREQQRRWDRLHYARVAIILTGFVLTVFAATVG